MLCTSLNRIVGLFTDTVARCLQALVNHYLDFVKALGLDFSMLLHFGMDGPNTNLSFERKMTKYLEENNTTILMIITCSLDPVHSAFPKGIKKFIQCTFQDISSSEKEKTGSFNIDDFFQDLHFFFKRLSARHEDYASLATVTGVTAEYMKKHAETWWVNMKYVALRCLEQWENLKEYFLKFLPQEKKFKKEVEKTQRYVRIKIALSEPIMEGVSCSLSVNRTYDSSPVSCSLQIYERTTEEIGQEDKVVIRWHYKKCLYQCWKWQEHKTLEQRLKHEIDDDLPWWPLI